MALIMYADLKHVEWDMNFRQVAEENLTLTQRLYREE